MTKKKQQVTRTIKNLVIVGDPKCGKRTLLISFSTNQFIIDYTSCKVELPTIQVECDGKTIHLNLTDAGGVEDFDRLRALLYREANVVLICFSVDNPTSVRNVLHKWAPEIRVHCEQCPIILVPCKIDLRTDLETVDAHSTRDYATVSTTVGEQLAAEIEADAYMECSAKTHEGIQELLNQAARLSLTKRKKRTRHSEKCTCILQ